MKRILSVIFCAALIFVILCSCSKTESPSSGTVSTQTTEAQTETRGSGSSRTVTLGYYSQYPLDPYKTTSKTNKNVMSLVYDSLFRLDGSYTPIPAVAQTYQLDGKTLTVVIRDGVVFSDGSPLTAEDVVYSFKKAKKSSLYSGRLSRFKSALANGNEVVFTLTVQDIYAVNCLDFPIVSRTKNSSGLPLGSGRYTIEKTGGGYKLNVSQSYSLEEQMELKEIALIDVNKTNNALYLVQIGELSFFYNDMSEDEQSERINANTVEVSLNNLVFLGVNNSSEYMSDMNVKNAVATAIDRSEITGSVYDSLAKPSAYPFNPDWREAAGLYAQGSDTRDTQLAQQLLEKSGYIYAYETNEYRSKNFDFIQLELIVSSQDPRRVQCAEIIKRQLKGVGVAVNVSTLEPDEYEKRLKSGDYDLYLGETKLPPNMDLSVFFSENGAANYTIDTKSTVANAYSDFIGGKIDISTFCQVFDEYKPSIPLCFRYGVAYFSRELQYEGTISENDMFSNIYSWSYSGQQ